MIKFEHTEVVGWEHAIRGMRNPFNSWDKNDSHLCNEDCPMVIFGNEPAIDCNDVKSKYCVGKNDLDLMKRLRSAGADHRKFLRMITVYTDITAPLYWWKEFDTYKVGTVANSCSTMHKIADKEFVVDDFSYEHLDFASFAELKRLVAHLNNSRGLFLQTKDRLYWWQMIQLLPSSYNQKRTVMLNYEVLSNIYKSRKNHKLDEWSTGFIGWIKSLPYAKELIAGE